MSSKLSKIIKIVLFTIIFIIVINGVYKALKWKDTTGSYLSSTEQLYATDKNLIDAVFVGTSHCYCGVFPSVLWEEYGIASFDMAISGQSKNSAYHDLIELYKTQNLKVVYVDLYAVLFDGYVVEANKYRNLMALNTSRNSIQLIHEETEDKEDRNNYILKFPIIHTRYTELEKKDFIPYSPNRFGRGEYYSFTANVAHFNVDALNNREVDEIDYDNQEWIDQLIDLAEQKETNIEFMILPFAATYDQMTVLNSVKAYLSDRGYSVIDFNFLLDETGISLKTDFHDNMHTNAYGAEKISRYLGEQIQSRYNLPDHRNDNRYEQWDQDLRWYNDLKISETLKNTDDFTEYIKNIAVYDEGITIISLEGTFWDNPDLDYFPTLALLGMDYDDYLEGGKWLYQNGQLQRIAYNKTESASFYRDINKYSTIKVSYMEEFDKNNIMINNTGYQIPAYCCVVTYDQFLDEIVANKGY